MKKKKLNKILREWNAELSGIEERLNWIQDAAAEVQKATNSAIFTDTGRNRVAHAHERITQEAHRLDILREGIASLSDQGNADRETLNKLVAQTSQLERSLSRKVDEVGLNERFANLVMRFRDIESTYATQQGFEDLITRVRNLESSTQLETSEDEPHMAGDHNLFQCQHSSCRRDAAIASVEAKAQLWANEEAAEEFSPPIGGVVRDVTGTQAMGLEQYERGLSAGAEKALQNAERHVQRFLRSLGWADNSPAMKAALAAIRGVQLEP